MHGTKKQLFSDHGKNILHRRTHHTEVANQSKIQNSENNNRSPAYSVATVNPKFGISGGGLHISGYSSSTKTKFNFKNKKISSP